MDDALRARLLRHAELHDDLRAHDAEQGEWADDLRALLAEVDRLRSDVSRQMAIATEHVNEVERLRGMLRQALRAWSVGGMMPKDDVDAMWRACSSEPQEEKHD